MSRVVRNIVTDSNGYSSVEGDIYTGDIEQISVNGYKCFLSKKEDRIWDNTKHEAWLFPSARDLKYLGTGSYRQPGKALEDPRIKGFVYTFNWKLVEPTFNTYNTVSIDTTPGNPGNPLLYALDVAHSLGKKIILRVWWKSYTGYTATPNPSTVSVPQYILDTPAYGGSTPGAYGVKPVYVGTTASGWGAAINRAEVFNRVVSLFEAIANSVVVGTHPVLGVNGVLGMHPALVGFCFDESTFGWVTNGVEPDNLSFNEFRAINRSLYLAQKQAFQSVNQARVASGLPAVDQIAIINYIDTTGSLTDAYNLTLSEQSYVANTMEMSTGYSDIDREDMRFKTSQPAFWQTVNDIRLPTDTTKSIVHIDSRSMTGSTFTSNIDFYQMENLNEAIRLSGGRHARIAILCEGYSSSSWLAVEKALTRLGVA